MARSVTAARGIYSNPTKPSGIVENTDTNAPSSFLISDGRVRSLPGVTYGAITKKAKRQVRKYARPHVCAHDEVLLIFLRVFYVVYMNK